MELQVQLSSITGLEITTSEQGRICALAGRIKRRHPEFKGSIMDGVPLTLYTAAKQLQPRLLQERRDQEELRIISMIPQRQRTARPSGRRKREAMTA